MAELYPLSKKEFRDKKLNVIIKRVTLAKINPITNLNHFLLN